MGEFDVEEIKGRILDNPGMEEENVYGKARVSTDVDMIALNKKLFPLNSNWDWEVVEEDSDSNSDTDSDSS